MNAGARQLRRAPDAVLEFSRPASSCCKLAMPASGDKEVPTRSIVQWTSPSTRRE